jgi:hypothetical protein
MQKGVSPKQHTFGLYYLFAEKLIELLKVILMGLPGLFEVLDWSALFFPNGLARARNFIFKIVNILLAIMLHGEP